MASFDQPQYQNSYVEDLATLLNNTSDQRPRIFLMGPRRSGKTSIQKVVFSKMSPHETLFIEPTSEVRKADYPPLPPRLLSTALVQFQLLDFPGNYDLFDKKSKVSADKFFSRAGALVFVIDSQDEDSFTDVIDYLIYTATSAYRANPAITLDVLVHKADGGDAGLLPDERRGGAHAELKRAILEELREAKLPIRVNFHLTSIFDYTIFEAFSKIVQQLISQLSHLEKLLDGLLSSCSMDKVFVFDVLSKLYLSTDSSPMDSQIYELCADMIDVVLDVSCIYSPPKPALTAAAAAGGTGPAAAAAAAAAADGDDSVATIRLNNGYVLSLRHINPYLALVTVMTAKSLTKTGLLDFNFAMFKESMSRLFKVSVYTSPPAPPGLVHAPGTRAAAAAAAAAAAGAGGGPGTGPGSRVGSLAGYGGGGGPGSVLGGVGAGGAGAGTPLGASHPVVMQSPAAQAQAAAAAAAAAAGAAVSAPAGGGSGLGLGGLSVSGSVTGAGGLMLPGPGSFREQDQRGPGGGLPPPRMH